jgi:hypothetical protein
MTYFKTLKDKVAQATPGLAEKTSLVMKRTKELAIQAGQKSAPIIKDATAKATTYAQENAPVVKARAKKALDDAIAHRAHLKEQAKLSKAAHDAYVDSMYLHTLTPQDQNYLDEPFTFFDRKFYFFSISGTVLDTEKRNQTHLSADHSSHHSSDGFIFNGYGGHSSNSSSHLSISSHNTTEHEFWLKLDDGKEMAFGLSNSNIPMRNGQRLTLFFCHESTSNTGDMCGLYNHASDQYSDIMTAGVINQRYGIYVKQAGWFDKQEVTQTRTRMLHELNKRLAVLPNFAATHTGDSVLTNQRGK